MCVCVSVCVCLSVFVFVCLSLSVRDWQVSPDFGTDWDTPQLRSMDWYGTVQHSLHTYPSEWQDSSSETVSTSHRIASDAILCPSLAYMAMCMFLRAPTSADAVTAYTFSAGAKTRFQTSKRRATFAVKVGSKESETNNSRDKQR